MEKLWSNSRSRRLETGTVPAICGLGEDTGGVGGLREHRVRRLMQAPHEPGASSHYIGISVGWTRFSKGSCADTLTFLFLHWIHPVRDFNCDLLWLIWAWAVCGRWLSISLLVKLSCIVEIRGVRYNLGRGYTHARCGFSSPTNFAPL